MLQSQFQHFLPGCDVIDKHTVEYECEAED